MRDRQTDRGSENGGGTEQQLKAELHSEVCFSAVKQTDRDGGWDGS